MIIVVLVIGRKSRIDVKLGEYIPYDTELDNTLRNSKAF